MKEKFDTCWIDCKREFVRKVLKSTFQCFVASRKCDELMYDRICNARFFERRVAMTVQLASKRNDGLGKTKDLYPP